MLIVGSFAGLLLADPCGPCGPPILEALARLGDSCRPAPDVLWARDIPFRKAGDPAFRFRFRGRVVAVWGVVKHDTRSGTRAALC